jgi:sugar (pentulose or hexulose) kinase
MSYIGIDVGTSGIRACAIDQDGVLLALCAVELPAPMVDGEAISQDPMIWWRGLEQVLGQLLRQIDGQAVQAIAIDGTSGTLLVTDGDGVPLAPARMYNDSACRTQAQHIGALAPEDSAARGASSGLARLLYLIEQQPEAAHALHQADWLAGRLCNRFDVSDENNALKTGYDPVQRRWPGWLEQLPLDPALLPGVLPPGSVIGPISADCARQFGLNTQTRIVTGTTDSIAAFIATGASRPGEAVTSLGSTLVVKIISEQPVYSAQYGIYSHRLGDHWLAGGASNSGGAVLKKYFSNDELKMLTAGLKPDQPTGLDYYPLTRPGERFPLSDPQLQPRLEPRPADDVEFFQGILEGIARIEQQAYERLHELGAPCPVSVMTAGGGSMNNAWTRIRQQGLGVPVQRARHHEACYGSALLALRASIQTQ